MALATLTKRCRATERMSSWRCRLSLFSAGRLDHFSGFQARGADLYPLRDSVYQCSNSLQVRIPSPVGQVVGVGNIVSKGRFLTADFTYF